MRLDAERLYLRPLTVDDVSERYVAWLNDSDVTRYLETRHAPQTHETVRAFVAGVNARENEHLFGVFERDGDRHVGNIKVGPVHPIHSMADVSLLIGEREVWGRGYAAEAICRIVRHAFEDLGVFKLSASLYAENIASERAFRKAGFLREGLRAKHYDLEGSRSDIVELGLCADEV